MSDRLTSSFEVGKDGHRNQKPLKGLFKEAVIASDPAIDEEVYVIIPSFHPTRLVGPCPWTPKLTSSSTYATPTKGDRALVVQSEKDDYWVVDWWPY